MADSTARRYALTDPVGEEPEVTRRPPPAPAVPLGRLPFGWILAAIVALAAVPRVWDALHTPLIFDEIYGIVFARMGLVRMLQTLAQDVDQPLQFVLDWAWRLIGGESAHWIKIPSLLFGIATVFLTARLGRRALGPAAALVGATLLALHPLHIEFSQQARFHSMVWFFLAAAMLAAWRWIRGERGRPGLILLLAGAASLYTDYFSAFILTGIALWGAWELRGDGVRLRRWLILFGGIVLLFAPQIPTLATQLARDIEGERHLSPMSPIEVVEFLRKLSFNARYAILPLVGLAALPLFRAATRRPAIFLWSVFLFSALVPWALSIAGIHLFLTRQFMFILPAFCLLMAAGACGFPRPIGAIVAALVVAFGARACLLRSPTDETITLPQAIDFIGPRTRPGDLVLCTETRAHLFIRYYLPDRDSRLLVMPETEPFHYSDGALAIPPEWRIAPEQWRARAASDPRWFGLRLQHAGRDGPDAARALDAAARGGKRTWGRVTVWSGAPSP